MRCSCWALGGLGITSIIANYTACQGDFSFANVGMVAGILGMSSNVFSALANPRIGAYVDKTGTYDRILLRSWDDLLPWPSVLIAILVFDWINLIGRPRPLRSNCHGKPWH